MLMKSRANNLLGVPYFCISISAIFFLTTDCIYLSEICFFLIYCRESFQDQQLLDQGFLEIKLKLKFQKIPEKLLSKRLPYRCFYRFFQNFCIRYVPYSLSLYNVCYSPHGTSSCVV